MAWPGVSASDIEKRWRPLTSDEGAVVYQRVADAVAELNFGLRDRGLTGTPVFDTTEESADWQTLYVATVVGAVRRYLVNPDGWLEEQESIDDYGRTRRRDKSISTGALYFSDDEIDKLVPRARPRRGAFTIRLGQS